MIALETGLLAAGLLTSVYWACLVLGGGLLLLSVAAAGHTDANVDGPDFDASSAGDVDFHALPDGHVDAGAHTDALHASGGLASWFSIRFVVFSIAVFGALGVILTHVAGAAPHVTLIVALLGGLAVGQGVHQVFRYVQGTSGNSTPRPRDYVERPARVTVPIVQPDKGEVTLQVRGALRYVPAVAGGRAQRLESGADVVVVAYRDGVATVVTLAEYQERLAGAEAVEPDGGVYP